MIIRPPPKLTNRSSVVKYVVIELWSWLKDLSISLLKLTFAQNFQSFTVNDLTIPAGIEVAIPNQFKQVYPGTIPSGRIIVRQQGNANIIDGSTTWTDGLVYLQNPSANDAVVSVIFFK